MRRRWTRPGAALAASGSNVKALWSLPLAARVHPAVLAAMAIAILSLDFLTGPYVQVAILFVFPVALATWNHGRVWRSVMAAALPLVRLPFFYLVWKVPSSWALEAADTGIDLIVLLALVQVISYIARQRREIQVLEGLLRSAASASASAMRAAGGFSSSATSRSVPRRASATRSAPNAGKLITGGFWSSLLRG